MHSDHRESRMAVLSCVTILRNIARVNDPTINDGAMSPGMLYECILPFMPSSHATYACIGGSLRGMGYNTMKKLGASFKDKILKYLSPAMRPNSVVYCHSFSSTACVIDNGVAAHIVISYSA